MTASTGWGGLIASLPLVSVLALIAVALAFVTIAGFTVASVLCGIATSIGEARAAGECE